MLDPHEKTYLRDLARDPVWTGILEKLADQRRVKGYRPSKGPESEQTAQWKYLSGFDDGWVAMIKTLTDGQ